jgi:copper transport protein
VAVDVIRSPGDWTVSVTVLRDGLPPATNAHQWPVPPVAQAGGSVLVSSAPLQPAISWLALLLALGLVGGAGWYGYRTWRRAPEPPVPSIVDTADAESSGRVPAGAGSVAPGGGGP